MKIIIIDGQGGKMGRAVIEQLRKSFPEQELLAIGTNSIATSSMMKAGAVLGATGCLGKLLLPWPMPFLPARPTRF